jgi:hypothetical protein
MTLLSVMINSSGFEATCDTRLLVNQRNGNECKSHYTVLALEVTVPHQLMHAEECLSTSRRRHALQQSIHMHTT